MNQHFYKRLRKKTERTFFNKLFKNDFKNSFFKNNFWKNQNYVYHVFIYIIQISICLTRYRLFLSEKNCWIHIISFILSAGWFRKAL